jgi:hypothetical protein
MSVEVDFAQWGQISLAPGDETTWWFTWIFDQDHWSHMIAIPDSDQSNIQILEQWVERDISHVTKHWCHFRNPGSTWVAFRPKVIVAPSRF